MSLAPAPALEQALAARQSPGLFQRFRERPLPGDLGLLLRIAANESEACEQACAISGETRPVIAEAAILYIQQVMFHPEVDSYRVFGVEDDAPDEQIREHRRWLLRWLHPDRNSDAWHAVYANRVTLAWQDLRSAERRAEYDARMGARLHSELADRRAPVLRQDHRLARYQDEGLLSARATRRLPIVVLGTLALGSISMLGLEFYLKRMDVAEPLAAEVAIPPIPAIERREPIESIETLEPLEVAPRIASTPSVAVIAAGRQPPSLAAALVTRGATTEGVPAAPVAMVPRSAPVALSAPSAPPASTAPTIPAASAPPITKSDPVPSVATVVATKSQPVEARAAPIPPIIIDDMLVAELVMKFRRAYASGRLEQMQALLAGQSPKAAGERKAILDAYERLFDSSRSRGIELRNVSWIAQGEVAVLIARYEAWLELRGDRKRRRETGDIRFDLRNEGGILRIARLRHSAKGD